jgi:hypothetical protein
MFDLQKHASYISVVILEHLTRRGRATLLSLSYN